MDDFGHAAWGYLIWYSTPFPALAAFMSVFADFVGFLPPYAAAFVRNNGDWSATWRKKNMPSWYARYRAAMYPWTHSLLVSLFVSGVSIAVFGWWTSWMLAWPLHVVVDIFSHPKEKAPAFLWPASSYTVHGMPWWSMRFMLVNYALLIVAAFFVLH